MNAERTPGAGQDERQARQSTSRNLHRWLEAQYTAVPKKVEQSSTSGTAQAPVHNEGRSMFADRTAII